MPVVTYEQSAEAVRAEIAKVYDEAFSDVDDLVEDLRLLSDDLSAIALSLEERLGIRLDRRRYRAIRTIASWAREIERASSRS